MQKVIVKMTETRIKRHGLEQFLDAVPGDSLSATGIDIKILSELAHLNLRGNLEDDRFKQAVHDALGQELPVSPNTSSDSAHRVFWLGPDEWLILTDSQTLLDELQNSLAGINGAVNDVSGGQIALRITGMRMRFIGSIRALA